jgi:MraZ protein
MLIGEYEYKVDNKGRLPLPPKFRHEFSDGLILTRGVEDCIVVYRKADFEKIASKYSSDPLAKSKMRKLSRFIFSNAFDMELDNQGRVSLPQPLKNFTGITNTAVIVGDNDHLELWNPEKWNEEQRASSDQAWQTIESLEGQT